MKNSCRYCQNGDHVRCVDVDSGTPCACPCPDTTAGTKAKRVRGLEATIRRYRQKLAAAEAELAELLNEEEVIAELPPEHSDPDDPLARYRRPGDRALGQRRLVLATQELNQK